jgi:AraC family transcriptional regulator
MVYPVFECLLITCEEETGIDTHKDLQRRIFEQREMEAFHAPYVKELSFYAAVGAGDLTRANELSASYPIHDMTGRGKLSDDPLRNFKYHVVITAALVTRFCIESGMDTATAYSLSDLYIQQTDHCTTPEQLVDTHRELYSDFANRMKHLRTSAIYSKHIVRCIDYIQNHLQDKLTVRTLAGNIGLNETYLSKLFASETGEAISTYIRRMKIESAQNMLKYLSFSCLSISNYLAFSSQSHFVHVFKAQTGMTPEEYRKKYFRSSWMRE